MAVLLRSKLSATAFTFNDSVAINTYDLSPRWIGYCLKHISSHKNMQPFWLCKYMQPFGCMKFFSGDG